MSFDLFNEAICRYMSNYDIFVLSKINSDFYRCTRIYYADKTLELSDDSLSLPIFSDLRTVDVSHNSKVSSLNHLSNLRDVNIKGSICGVGIRGISKLKNIRKLDISFVDVDASLNHFTLLVTLIASNCFYLTDYHICDLKNLKHLDIFLVRGVTDLNKFDKLEQIDIRYSGVKQEGISQLKNVKIIGNEPEILSKGQICGKPQLFRMVGKQLLCGTRRFDSNWKSDDYIVAPKISEDHSRAFYPHFIHILSHYYDKFTQPTNVKPEITGSRSISLNRLDEHLKFRTVIKMVYQKILHKGRSKKYQK